MKYLTMSDTLVLQSANAMKYMRARIAFEAQSDPLILHHVSQTSYS